MMISTATTMTTLFKVKYNSIGNAGHDWTSKLSQKSKAAATSLIGLIRFVAWKKKIFLLYILGTFLAPAIDVPFFQMCHKCLKKCSIYDFPHPRFSVEKSPRSEEGEDEQQPGLGDRV